MVTVAPGEPGKPGLPGKGQAGGEGGAGGAGGRGGEGDPHGAGGGGGVGGEGGVGAPGRTGPRGERGERGPTNRRALIGYLILSLAAIGGFVRVEQIANQQEAQIERAADERREIDRRFREADFRLATQDERHQNALRSVLCLARTNTLTSRQRTPEEKARIVRFYDQALDSINARPCDKEE